MNNSFQNCNSFNRASSHGRCITHYCMESSFFRLYLVWITFKEYKYFVDKFFRSRNNDILSSIISFFTYSMNVKKEYTAPTFCSFHNFCNSLQFIFIENKLDIKLSF